MSLQIPFICDNLKFGTFTGNFKYLVYSVNTYRTMYVLQWWTFYMVARGIIWCLNIKNNTRVHKQFVTRVHALFHLLRDIMLTFGNRCLSAESSGHAWLGGCNFHRKRLLAPHGVPPAAPHHVKLSRAIRPPWVDRFLNNEIYCYPLSKKRCGPPLRPPEIVWLEGIVTSGRQQRIVWAQRIPERPMKT